MKSSTAKKMAGSEFELRKLEREAREQAESILERYAIEEASHLVLEAIARDLGAEVVEGSLDGCVARLVRSDDRGLIRISPAITNRGRRRFCVAHELGHFVLRHSETGWLSCADGQLDEFGGAEAARLETQANMFASELLLPEALVRKRCEVSPVDFGPVKRLRDDFQTSLTATAIRFVRFSSEACAIVFSKDGKVKWSRKSEDFKLRTLHIHGWGEALPVGSMAETYFRRGDLYEEPIEVGSDAWLVDWSAEKVPALVEHSIAIHSLGGVLTLLWIPVSQEEDEE